MVGAACKTKGQPPPQGPQLKQPGAPREEMPEGEWEQWRQKIEKRERERANRPPPELEINWPSEVETDLAEFNGWWIRIKGRIEFQKDHKQVTPEAMDILDDVVFILQETPRITKIEIQSHRHSRMETYGERITQLRANTVKIYLVGQGIAADRIETKGYADAMPIESNTSEFGRRANTRIEIIVRQIDKHAVNVGQ